MSQLPKPVAFDVLDLLSQSEKSPASTVLDTQSPSMLPTLPETLTQLPGVQLPFSFPTGDGESPTFVASPEQPVKRIKLVDVCCETLSLVFIRLFICHLVRLSIRSWQIEFDECCFHEVWHATTCNVSTVYSLRRLPLSKDDADRTSCVSNTDRIGKQVSALQNICVPRARQNSQSMQSSIILQLPGFLLWTFGRVCSFIFLDRCYLSSLKSPKNITGSRQQLQISIFFWWST